MELRLERLNNNQDELERFARENFLMKKEGEDIILIREKTSEYKEEKLNQLEEKNSTKVILITILLILLVTIIIMLNMSKKNDE